MDLYRLLCALSMGGLFCLALLLLFMRAPMQHEWQSFRKAKLFTALARTDCSDVTLKVNEDCASRKKSNKI